jgi:hypothetical protein
MVIFLKIFQLGQAASFVHLDSRSGMINFKGEKQFKKRYAQ